MPSPVAAVENPRKAKGLSVRARMTLGNVLIFGLILSILAMVLRYGAQVWLDSDMDHDLADRAHRAANRRSLTAPGTPPGTPNRTTPSNSTARNPTSEQFPPKLLDLKGNQILTGELDHPWDAATFKRSTQGESHYSTRVVSGTPVRIYSIPIRRDGKTIGVVQTAGSLADSIEELRRLSRMLMTLIPVALLAAAAGGVFVTARALRPVREITQAAGRIEARNLSGRLRVSGGDELAELASTFNGMLERLEQAFDQQRRFTADASHELRTPLAAIKGDVSLALSGDRSAPEYRETLVAVGSAADRMNRIVQDLLLLARSDGRQMPLDLQLLGIGTVMQDAVRAVSPVISGNAAPPAPIRMFLPTPGDLYVVGDTHYLERLFLNLLENARRHTPPEGEVTFAAREAGDSAVITVSDTGEGIAPEHLPHVFESFYRVDSARSRASGGTGLGLAISKSIVEAHSGTITIESAPNQGTTVTVTIPQARLTD